MKEGEQFILGALAPKPTNVSFFLYLIQIVVNVKMLLYYFGGGGGGLFSLSAVGSEKKKNPIKTI